MNRTVVVTGASSGIGLETCVYLVGLGFRVVAVVESSDSLPESLQGPDIEVLTADLADPTARAGLLGAVEPWALVNNAGYMNAGQLRDVPLHDARRQFEAMVFAPVDLIHQVLPSMMARGQGRIVNVTSSAAHTSTPLTGWYAAAKAALRELNDAFRVELRATGVDVVDIEPGGYRTGIWDRAARELAAREVGSANPELYERARRHLAPARRRMADPRQVAEAIGDVLTTGDPPPHVRIGPGARWLRMADAIVPDKLWDALAATAAGDGITR
jgi:NAD(P)-dependent dehydrogenase (short-subunit alcohol dehydrogenase family)